MLKKILLKYYFEMFYEKTYWSFYKMEELCQRQEVKFKTVLDY